MAHPDPSHASDCFGCKIRSVGFSLGSVNGVLQGSGGRAAFHGPTIAQRREEALRECKAAGTEPREVTRREKAEYGWK